MEEYNEQEYGIIFMELLLALKEKIVVIFIATFIAAIAAWGISFFLITPQYEASVNMIVNTRTDATGNVTNDNISSAQNLVDTYAIIIKSNTVLNKVINELDLELSFEELYEKVSVDAINNTQVMKIAVQNENPLVAQKVVGTISEVAPDIITDAVEAGSCKVVSQVYVDEEPVSPDVLKITIIFGLHGFFICIGIIVLKEILNDYIVDDIDVEKKLGITVLGIIPDVERK